MAELANKVVDVRELPTNAKLTEEHPTGFRVPARRRHSSAVTSDIALHWWSSLGTSHPSESLDDLAARVGVSSRHIRYLIASEFGLTPKGWQRLARYHRAQRLIKNGSPLARAAAEAGYADQPHLQREWRTFALQTPASSMRSEYLPHASLPGNGHT